MPRKFVYQSLLKPADVEFIIGRALVLPLQKGEPITWHHVKHTRASVP